jgi:hypothetical protein
MSTESTPTPEPKTSPRAAEALATNTGTGRHKLTSKVRPALPDDKAPWSLLWVARLGHVVIPLNDRPGQREMIEHAGGVWDPKAEAWIFDNVKKRDAAQREIDVAKSKISDAVRSTTKMLAPGLNLCGADYWKAIRDLPQAKRHPIEIVDLKTIKPATLVDYIKKTGVPAVLTWLLEQELPDSVIKAARTQLDGINAGKVSPKVSR